MLDESKNVMYDVVIAGAGPVGLFLACELRLRDISVLVLEQQDEPDSPFKKLPFGMRGLTTPTVEAFYRRGLLDDITRGNPASITSIGLQPGHQAGHFAGIQFFHSDIDASRWDYRLPGPAVSNMAVELERLEKALADRAYACGVEIRRGCAVQDFDQLDDVVTIHTGSDDISAKWLIGCDGGRSTVRKVGGFEFVGTDPEFTGYSALVEMADRDKLLPGKNNTPNGMYSLAPTGHIIMADFDGGAMHRKSITIEHLQSVLRRISNTNATIAAIHTSATWTDRAAQATNYRKGRTLLAGDAAHIHSPLGGQGLNLGFGDAVNLGWKLAATIHGWAPEGLLDTYSTERHPVGVQILHWSRAQVALMRPDPGSRALVAIMRDILVTRDGATYFAERVMGLTLRYDLGGGNENSHSLVGRSVPDFELVADGTRLGTFFRDGKGLLVDFKSCAELQDIGTGWSDRIKYVTGEVKERMGLSALLVRPDGIVAWVCEERLDINIDEVRSVGMRWFGVGR